MFIAVLILVGLVASTVGTLIGAGGGFLVVPILISVFKISPVAAAATGLAIVFLNSIAGLPLLIKQKRILFKIGLFIALGAIPGIFIGNFLLKQSPDGVFYFLFGCLLIGLGIYIMIKNLNPEVATASNSQALQVYDSEANLKSLWKYAVIGILLGIISSFFGIGGGWLLVPILAYRFGISIKFATATSMFSLALYTFFGLIPFHGESQIDWSIFIWTGIGVLIGAQLGAILSKRIKGVMIARLLAFLVIVMGIHMFVQIV